MVSSKGNGFRKIVIGAVLILSSSLWVGTANAAKKTPAEKARAQYEKCENKGGKMIMKCDKIKKEDKREACLQKTRKYYEKCIDKLRKGLAKKNQKALDKRKKALAKCYKKNKKCIKKCKDDQGCQADCMEDMQDFCIEKIDEKHPLVDMPTGDE